MDTVELAFVGLGNMGSGMARRLVDREFAVTVHNRTAAKAEALVAAGARSAASAAEAARGKRIVLLSLSDEAAVEGVLFDSIVPVLEPGAFVVDTSTVSPLYAVHAARRLADAGLHRVEACVVGNPQQARGGELRVFTAGEQHHADAVRHVLAALGSEVVHVGAAGCAATLKLVFNLVLGGQVAALAEAVNYGAAAGLNRDLLLSSIAQSGFSSMVMKFRAELMRQRHYEPAFFRSRLMEKDLRIALEDAGDDADFPVLRSVFGRFSSVVAAGDGDKDAAVLIEHRPR